MPRSPCPAPPASNATPGPAGSAPDSAQAPASTATGQAGDLLARRLARGVGRLFADLGAESLTEVPLKGGRRADVLAIDRKGRVLIAEIKSGPADFRSDNKWPEYQDWCDVFYFAVAEDFPRALLPDSTGLIIADAFSAAIIREAPEQPLASARRKALTLRFARLAAARWRRLSEELGGPAAPPEKDSATDPC